MHRAQTMDTRMKWRVGEEGLLFIPNARSLNLVLDEFHNLT